MTLSGFVDDKPLVGGQPAQPQDSIVVVEDDIVQCAEEAKMQEFEQPDIPIMALSASNSSKKRKFTGDSAEGEDQSHPAKYRKTNENPSLPSIKEDE